MFKCLTFGIFLILSSSLSASEPGGETHFTADSYWDDLRNMTKPERVVVGVYEAYPYGWEKDDEVTGFIPDYVDGIVAEFSPRAETVHILAPAERLIKGVVSGDFDLILSAHDTRLGTFAVSVHKVTQMSLEIWLNGGASRELRPFEKVAAVNFLKDRPEVLGLNNVEFLPGSATFLRMLSANRVDAIIGFRELFSAYAYKDNIDITQFSHQRVGKVPVYLWVSRESHMSNYIDELMNIAWTHKLKGAPEPTPY